MFCFSLMHMQCSLLFVFQVPLLMKLVGQMALLRYLWLKTMHLAAVSWYMFSVYLSGHTVWVTTRHHWAFFDRYFWGRVFTFFVVAAAPYVWTFWMCLKSAEKLTCLKKWKHTAAVSQGHNGKHANILCNCCHAPPCLSNARVGQIKKYFLWNN